MKKLLLLLLSAALVFSCSEESIETSTPQFVEGEKTVTLVLTNIPEGFEGEDLYIFTLDNLDSVYYIQSAKAIEGEEVQTIPTPGGTAYSVIAYIPTITDWTSKDPFSNGYYSGVSLTLNKEAKFVTNVWTESFGLNKSGATEALEVELAVSGDSSYLQGEIFVLSATTADNVEAGISSLSFTLNGSTLENVNEEPYSINVNTINFPVGKHIVGVTATNGNGDVATDEIEITITANVNTAPSVSISGVNNDDEFERQTIQTIFSGASDADGNLDRVEFIINGSTVTTVTAESGDLYQYEWDTYDNQVGLVTIEVAAFDTDGATRSDFVNVTLVDPADYNPRVEITNPSEGNEFNVGAQISFTAATDDPGNDNVCSVRWTVNGPTFTAPGVVVDGTSTSWDTTGYGPGVYTITANVLTINEFTSECTDVQFFAQSVDQIVITLN